MRRVSAVLISIELLGCSAVMVFFVGFSISKIDVLARDGQTGLTDTMEVGIPKKAGWGGWEAGRATDAIHGTGFRALYRTYVVTGGRRSVSRDVIGSPGGV